MTVKLQDAAVGRLDEIYNYSRARWGEAQARSYIEGLFLTFEKIKEGSTVARPIPRAFGVDEYYCRFGRHFIYWRHLSSGDIGIVTILHERMHQMAQLRSDLA